MTYLSAQNNLPNSWEDCGYPVHPASLRGVVVQDTPGFSPACWPKIGAVIPAVFNARYIQTRNVRFKRDKGAFQHFAASSFF
jgi:hypothetical protein